MAYQSNIPQPNNQISRSQDDLLNNFIALNQYLTVNHTDIDGTANQGKHKWVSLPEQTVAPGTLANEAAIFSAQGLYSAATELYWQRENNGGQIPFTELFNPAPGVTSFYLPNQFIIKIGTITVPAQGVPGNNFIIPAPLIWPVVVNTPAFTQSPFVFAQVVKTTVGGNRDIIAIVNASGTNNLQVEITCQLTTTTWSSFNVSILAMGI